MFCITDAAFAKTKARNKVLTKKVKSLSFKVWKQGKKIESLKTLLSELKAKQLLQIEPATIIEQCFDDKIIDIIQNEYKNHPRHEKGRRYSNEVKHFALTLHYYSPQAYEFCRDKLKLPHPSSLKHWLSNIHCEPGLLADVIESASKSVIKDYSLVIAVCF